MLDLVRAEIRLRHSSYSTEKSQVDWVYRYAVFPGKKHSGEIGKEEAAAFMTHLAVERKEFA